MPHHVREIRDVLQFAPLRYVLFLRGKPGAVFQKFNDLGKVLRPVDCYPIGNACLLGVRLGRNMRFTPFCAAVRTIDSAPFTGASSPLSDSSPMKAQSERSAEITPPSFISAVIIGRSNIEPIFRTLAGARIHCDAAVEKLQVELTEHRPDTRLALLHGNIRHSHDVESGLPGGNTRLDRYHECV